MNDSDFAPAQRNWLVWFDQTILAAVPPLRATVAAYFRPTALERAGSGRIFRMLGVHWLAYIIPTGGLLWRRLFHWDGWSFALQEPTERGAREYRYNTCVFEILHLSAILLMLPDGIWAFQHNYQDGILKFVLAGLLMNGYPILLQRYNRVRIARILMLIQRRRAIRQS